MAALALSVLGILVSGALGGVAGWAVITAFGLTGIPAALLAAVIGMVVAVAAWVALTVALRSAGWLR